jgi:hypothetical protein
MDYGYLEYSKVKSTKAKAKAKKDVKSTKDTKKKGVQCGG